MNKYRQKAIRLIVDVIYTEFFSDGMILIEGMSGDELMLVYEEIEDIATELFETLPTPRLPIIPPYDTSTGQ